MKEKSIMSKRTLSFDWSSLTGARKKKRKLHLESDDDGMYICPVKSCLQEGYKSKRGLRKHVNSKHEWYLYFEIQPDVNRHEARKAMTVKKKAVTNRQPAFAIDQGCGLAFVKWLQTPCGGGKNWKEAKQIAKRGMKYLMHCLGDIEDGVCGKDAYIDCCVGSPTMLMKFLKVLFEDWGLKSSGALTYMKAVTDLCDFRKCQGVPDTTLRLFAVTEVYLRRTKSTLQRQKNIEYTRNLSLESLIAQGSWASLEEVEKVIPHHAPKYQSLFQKAAQSGEKSLNVSEIAFLTRFIITFLLLRVKCTRPMSLQFLTVEMVEAAAANDGFVDQTKFKTQGQYVFDSLKFSNDALDVLDMYIRIIRPLCKPKCNYVILTTNGTQYTAFCNAMSILTHEAIGKHITPTRYRAIVESESVVRLDKEKQAIITHDQKHGSVIAKRCYQKKLSREVAKDGANAMKELVGEERDQHTGVLASALRKVDQSVQSSQCVTINEDAEKTISIHDNTDAHEGLPAETIIVDETKTSPVSVTDEQCTSKLIQEDDIEVKMEEIEQGKKFLTFTDEEVQYLKAGITKHSTSKRKWSDILNDPEYEFQKGRSRDSLRVRAATLGLENRKSTRRNKLKK